MTGANPTVYLSSPLPVITAPFITIDNYNLNGFLLTINGNNIPGPVYRYTGSMSGSPFRRGVNFSPGNHLVTTTAAAGPGSLLQIQDYCEQTIGKDYIYFNIPGAGPHVVSYPTNSNIYFNQPVTIDGTTQPANGYTGAMPKIILAKHLVFYGQNSELYGITMDKTASMNIDASSRLFPNGEGHANGTIVGKPGGSNVFFGGIYIVYAADVTFQNNYVGMDVQSLPESTIVSGLYFSNTRNTKVLNNNIGNCTFGINSFRDTNTVISGNKIGTNSQGTLAVPNEEGLSLNSSFNFTLGGTGTGQGNIISGNLNNGIVCSAVKQMVMQGNYIGTDVTGMLSIPNSNGSSSGVNGADVSFNGCDSIVIGGNSSAAGNVVSTGKHYGVDVLRSQKIYLYGNKIGVAKDGVTLLANGYGVGVKIEYGSTVEVGKLTSGYSNIISIGPSGCGIWVDNPHASAQYQSSVSIRGNSFFNNRIGISSIDGAIPVITNVTTTKVEGISDPLAAVDLYYHNGNGAFQGKTYFATVAANAAGSWTYNGSLSNACNITAAATKGGRTTQFSQQYKFGNLGPDRSICQGSSPITLTASGGSNYSWSPATGLSDATIANPVFQPNATQTYIVSLTNSLGCAGSDTLNIFVDEALTKPKLGADTALCTDTPLLLNGGVYNNASYLWSTGATSQTIQGFAENTYYLTVANSCGSVKDTLSITTANCGEISGIVYDDYNSNCTYDLTDAPLKRTLVKILPGPLYALTDTTGYYSVRVPYNTYDISLLPMDHLTAICHPGNYTATVSSSHSIVSQNDYALYNANATGGRIVLSSGVPVVGRSFTYTLCIENTGILNFSGSLLFHYDEWATFVSADLAPADHTDRTLTFNCADLAPGKTQVIHLVFSVLPDASLSGKSTTATAELLLSDDFNPSDNLAQTTSIIRSSYDPNVKEVFPVGATAAKWIPAKDSVLCYTIRFQNEGTAPADSITIRDTLSTYLNIETLVALNASHAYSVAILGNNVIQWTFKHINLPAKTTDEERSQGYVQFSIHTQKDLAPLTKIKNAAYIYFDHNPLIATNTVFNTMAFPLSGTTASEDLGCAEGNLTLAAVPQGGIPPYVYAWENRTETDSLLNNLITGTYTCTVTDASGQEIELTENISEPAALSISGTVTNVSCQGNNDGQISLTAVSGGTPGYTFDWSNEQSTMNISQLSADTYTVTMTDGDNCSVTASFVLTESTVSCLSTSTNASSSVELVSVYPNPAKENAVFDVSSEGNFNLVIKDMTGREVFRKENISGNSYTLSKTNLGSGIFMYSVYHETKELGKGKLIVLD